MVRSKRSNFSINLGKDGREEWFLPIY